MRGLVLLGPVTPTARSARRSRFASLFCVGVFVAAVCGSRLEAQDTQDEEARSTRDLEAHSLFEAGNLAFADGRYEDALTYFQRAHELSERPEMLFNIGTAAERLRHDEEALAAYEAFLEERPEAENRRETEARIAILRDSIAAANRSTEPASASESDGERNYTFAWVSGAAAVVFIGLGTAGRIAGNNAYEDLLTRCAEGCTDQEVDDSSVVGWDRLTVTSFSLGALAVVGAVVGVVVAPKRDSRTAVRIGPTQVSIQGRF